MGNEQSQMPGLIVEEKAVEVTDFWSHHSASLDSENTTVSVFIGEPLVGGSLWLTQTPLEKSSKNLMLHRHPCILRYVSSWSKSSKYYLAVENVKPLSHALQSQSVLQICIGLHSILKGLVFLHARALASHNNVCTASIYVTKDGSWKLGGLEYLCKFKDITKEYMSKSRAHRYDKAIDPNEDKQLGSQRLDFIDVYAFAVLVNEVFKSVKGSKDDLDSIPLQQFLERCKTDLHHSDVEKRPKLATILQDGFFNHDFITIHSFLVELPLKSDQEKDTFFITLIQRLRHFKQAIVAKQLGGLLLSRMVLLNKTAQKNVIPRLLALKNVDNDALFDSATFRKFVVPTLLEIFCVRDAQIRLLLLEHFNNFMGCFSKEQLQNNILPELLLGIKDTNDHLVSVTLRSLADLVPILGSAIVIGGKRAKLFNDGLPIAHKPSSSIISRRQSSRTHDLSHLPPSELLTSLPNENDLLSNSSGTENHADLILNERPSPDGEEGDTSTITDEAGDDNQVEEGSPSTEVWDDWDINDTDTIDQLGDTQLENITSATTSLTNNLNSSINPVFMENVMESNNSNNSNNNNRKVEELPDIFELDIKNLRNNAKSDEFDFFQDMEPVINKSTKFVIGEEGYNLIDFTNGEENESKISGLISNDGKKSSKFDWSVNVNAEHLEEGWGDDLDGWE